jgi:hypothetical protein
MPLAPESRSSGSGASRQASIALAFALSFLLFGCGGGGDESSTAALETTDQRAPGRVSTSPQETGGSRPKATPARSRDPVTPNGGEAPTAQVERSPRSTGSAPAPAPAPKRKPAADQAGEAKEAAGASGKGVPAQTPADQAAGPSPQVGAPQAGGASEAADAAAMP